MRNDVLVAGLLAIAALAPPADAQTSAGISLSPPDAARWDGFLGIGHRAQHDPDVDFGDRWANAASLSASLGYYWTTHLKTDVTVTAATETTQFGQRRVDTGGGSSSFPIGEQRRQPTGLSGGVIYQFGENAWVHPFVGGGIEAVRERSQFTVRQQSGCLVGTPCSPALVPVQDTSRSDTRARPYLTAGIKFYFTRHAFIRTDVRASFAGQPRIEAVLWHAGIGADF